MGDAKYYDWDRTISYDADVTMVVGTRGVGKTFGLRLACIKRCIKLQKKGDQRRYVEIVRTKAQLSVVSDNYFSRLSRMPELAPYVFRSDSHYMWWADAPEDENTKPKWNLLGYFVAMTVYQIDKTRTFDYVDRLIFDECILDRQDRFHRYLPNEFAILANIVDTISRERKDTAGLRPHVFLLGNAVDITNPYFARYHVGTDISYGYRWYENKTFLLHFVDSSEYNAEKADGTVAGRMLSGTVSGKENVQNIFHNISSEFVQRKPKRAKFMFGIVLDGKTFGIWSDVKDGYYYVTAKVPHNTDRPIYAMSYEDNRVNYIAANRLHQVMRGFAEMYWMGIVRYDSVDAKRDFYRVLELLGIK